MSPQLDLLPMTVLEDAAECLKILGHPVRLRIVDILMQGQFPVGGLAEMCGIQPHQASEHLRLLHGHGLLDSERRGRRVFYGIGDPRLPGVLDCIRSACEEGEN